MTDPIVIAAQFLAGHVEWIRHRPEADEFLTDVEASLRVLRSITRGPSDLQFLGICGALVTWDDEGAEIPRDEPCPGHVFGGTKHGTCKSCGARWDDVSARLARVTAAVREGLYHVSEIAAAYPEIKDNTIRAWLSRGLLVAHGERDGRPLLKLGEVLDLAAGDVARREEARATRARRAAARAAESETAA
jgi:hypothetical protein